MTDRRETWLFLLPGLALLVLGFVLPIARMLVLSVQGPDGYTVDQFARFFQDGFYPSILWRTVYLSLVITVICSLIGFPLSYIMARGSPRVRLWLVIMVILPLMTSVVVRTFGWMVLLGRNGLIASTLRDFGLVGRSFQLMHTETAILLGMVQVLLPFTRGWRRPRARWAAPSSRRCAWSCCRLRRPDFSRARSSSSPSRPRPS